MSEIRNDIRSLAATVASVRDHLPSTDDLLDRPIAELREVQAETEILYAQTAALAQSAGRLRAMIRGARRQPRKEA